MFSFLNTRLLTRSSRQLQLAVPARNISVINKTETPSEANLVSFQSVSEKTLLSTDNEPPSGTCTKGWAQRLESVNDKARLPRSVQAVYLRPLRRKAEYGLPVCDLQLRSYSVRNVEFFADFAVRAAYYLKLPVSGPIPLPRIVERWTFPRSNFVHKKSQENFERITLRRLIQIKDGSPQAVQAWLAFLRKHAFYGVGMKANVWEQESLDVVRSMDKGIPDVEQSLAPHLSQFGRRKAGDSNNSAPELLDNMGSVKHRSPLTDVRKG